MTNTKHKAYKCDIHNYSRMFPGDPTGLPDDFFLMNYLMFGSKI